MREHRLHIISSVCVSWFSCFSLGDCGNRLNAFSSKDVRFFRNSSLRVHQLLCDTIPLIMRGRRRNRFRTDSVWRTEFCGEAKKVLNVVILLQYRLRIVSQILQNYLCCAYRQNLSKKKGNKYKIADYLYIHSLLLLQKLNHLQRWYLIRALLSSPRPLQNKQVSNKNKSKLNSCRFSKIHRLYRGRGGGVLPAMAYTGRLLPKGVPFSFLSWYMKG